MNERKENGEGALAVSHEGNGDGGTEWRFILKVEWTGFVDELL